VKKQSTPLLSLTLATVAVACLFVSASSASPAKDDRAKSSKYVPVTEYDPQRDAAADVAGAVAEARRAKKNIIVEVGGKWCSWCRIMDDYFQRNADVLRLREENYVTVKVNFSPENENKELLSKYPEIPGYPHIFVLDAGGGLLHSQFTGDLEEGKSYNHDKMVAFLKGWSPKK
jgi:thiol:disulfide interchange protein